MASLSVPTQGFTQKEATDLLESLLTLLTERRMQHSQKVENAKRLMNDADNAFARSAAGTSMDHHSLVENEMHQIILEMKHILENFGVGA